MDRQRKVMGVHAPPSRITYRAVRLGAIWIGMPLIAFCFLLDFLFNAL